VEFRDKNALPPSMTIASGMMTGTAAAWRKRSSSDSIRW
jgi:hypothetical protein